MEYGERGECRKGPGKETGQKALRETDTKGRAK
jgi:hypothetical protein